ncbi:MAG: site-specific DNA-methyltransferase [Candidatus Diapherotrites archaeon]
MEMNSILNNVFQGDAIEIMKKFPDCFVDVSITSPPYNKGEKHKGWLVENVKYHSNSDNVPENTYQQQQIEVLNEVYRITKEGGHFFYNHKTRWNKGQMIHPMEWLTKTNWTIRQEIIWDRTIAANIRGWRFWQVDERIYWLYKPVGKNKIGKELESKHALLTSIWKIMPERENGHPAPFPIELPTRIIYSVIGKDNGVVFDPYVGSGTTLVAAKLLGHKYVGIDISPIYVKDAIKRLSNCENERERVEEEIAKHLVRETFKERKENGKWTQKEKSKDKFQKTLLPIFASD